MNINNHIHHGDGAHIYQVDGGVPQLLFGLLFVLVGVMYIVAAVVSNHRYKQWPHYRTVFWVSGVFCAASAMIGPLANRAHIDFKAHMLGHLLLGMLAPLLMVLAAPMTLVLRTLNLTLARRLSSILKSWFIRILLDPIIVSLLNIGGLWILYTTDLFTLMQHNIL